MTTGISRFSGSLFDQLEHLVSIEIRHHQIEQNKAEFLLL
jgi:hypothetical protein